VVLDTPNRSLEIRLQGSVTTSQLPVIASFTDESPAESAGTEIHYTSNTNAITIVPAPTPQTKRTLTYLNIPNVDSATAVLILQLRDGDTVFPLTPPLTMATGDTLFYTDQIGWSAIDSQGRAKALGSGGGGGGSTNPGGVSGQLQYNSAGSFGAVAAVTTNGTGLTVTDNTFVVQCYADPTKHAVLDATGISPSTTRTYSLPNANTTLVGTNTADSLSNKTIIQPVIGDYTNAQHAHTWGRAAQDRPRMPRAISLPRKVPQRLASLA
jgi:hypothetical protein